MGELHADVAVVGGGLGGVAAALAAARHGRRVVVTEEGPWLGGQLTAQAVPPDEHPWIEQFGCTASYRTLREGIRAYYRRWYPLTAAARSERHLNPGGGWVSNLCCEPGVAVAVIDALLAPHRAAGRVRVLHHHRPVTVATGGDRIDAVTVEHSGSGERTVLVSPYVLDATETGEVLALGGVEHVTGSEARADTGEPHAGEQARPDNQQAVTHCFALTHHPGEDHTIGRPDGYERLRDLRLPGWPGPLLDLAAPDPKTGETVPWTLTPNPSGDPLDVRADMRAGGRAELWTFRRIAARQLFADGAYPSDVTLVNWPQADYTGGPIIGPDAAAHRAGARALAQGLLYWLQTEAPRPDGGTGWPGLKPCPEVLGTPDGFAQAVYVRESRRLRGVTTVREQDLSMAVRGDAGARSYPDRVGVGCYRIDLHPTTGGDGYVDIGAHPYEIPLGALLPVRVTNLLPAAKNLATTHVTNGCYRLHPTEWNVGEAAGLLAVYCLERATSPHAVHGDVGHLAAFQDLLTRDGVELRWPQVRGY